MQAVYCAGFVCIIQVSKAIVFSAYTWIWNMQLAGAFDEVPWDDFRDLTSIVMSCEAWGVFGLRKM